MEITFIENARCCGCPHEGCNFRCYEVIVTEIRSDGYGWVCWMCMKFTHGVPETREFELRCAGTVRGCAKVADAW
jgi:hypothetical protein